MLGMTTRRSIALTLEKVAVPATYLSPRFLVGSGRVVFAYVS